MRMFAILLSVILPFSTLAVASEKHVDAVIFEYWDVMVNPDKTQVISWVKETFDFTKDELSKAIKNYRDSEGTRDFWESYAKDMGKTVPDEWKKLRNEQKILNLKEDAAMFGMVKHLKNQGLITCMLSNVGVDEAEMIESRGHFHMFEPLSLSCFTNLKKPDVEAFQNLLEELQLEACDCLYIDVDPVNLHEAKKLGFNTIEFKGAKHLKKKLKKQYGIYL